MTGNPVISELHHGNWWSKSWQTQCPDSMKRKILVPILLYMDGISPDTHNRLSLTPLNIFLGIYNIETQKKDGTWKCIYFHPDSSLEALDQKVKANSVDNLTNLHMWLAAALSLFKEWY